MDRTDVETISRPTGKNARTVCPVPDIDSENLRPGTLRLRQPGFGAHPLRFTSMRRAARRGTTHGNHAAQFRRFVLSQRHTQRGESTIP